MAKEFNITLRHQRFVVNVRPEHGAIHKKWHKLQRVENPGQEQPTMYLITVCSSNWERELPPMMWDCSIR